MILYWRYLTAMNLRTIYSNLCTQWYNNEKSLDYVFNKAKFNKVKSIYYQRYGLDNHLSWLNNRQPGGDIRFEELFGLNVEYKDKSEIIKKTDTIFYIAELSCDK